MESLNSTSTATTTAARSGPPDILTPMIDYFKTTQISSGFGDTAMMFLSQAWFYYTLLAYLMAFIFLYIFLYASIRVGKIEEAKEAMLAAQRKSYEIMYGQPTQLRRWNEVETYLNSENPNDWKLGVIEADIILDDFLKRNGYSGDSLGERLKSIPSGSLQSLDDAWEAHKLRNQIAHGGADFALTKKMTEDAIIRYKKVFTEFGII